MDSLKFLGKRKPERFPIASSLKDDTKPAPHVCCGYGEYCNEKYTDDNCLCEHQIRHLEGAIKEAIELAENRLILWPEEAENIYRTTKKDKPQTIAFLLRKTIGD